MPSTVSVNKKKKAEEADRVADFKQDLSEENSVIGSTKEQLSKFDTATDTLKELIRSRTPVIYIISDEKEKNIIDIVHKMCEEGTSGSKFKKELYTWDCARGFLKQIMRKGNTLSESVESEALDPATALDWIQTNKGDTGSGGLLDHVYILSEFHHYFRDPSVQRRLRIFSEITANQERKVIIMLSTKNAGTQGKALPPELENLVYIQDWPYPDGIHIQRVLSQKIIPTINKRFAKADPPIPQMKFDHKQMTEIVGACKGMTVKQIEEATTKSVVRKKTLDPRVISLEKKQIIKKSGSCDYVEPDQTMSDIGGLDVLKDWLKQRKSSLTEDAIRFGCDLPKGLLCVGPWGSGKTSVAKAIISEWGLPGLRIDVSRMFGMYVGESICGDEEVVLFDQSSKNTIKVRMDNIDFWNKYNKSKNKNLLIHTMDRNNISCLKRVTSHITHKKNDRLLFEIKLLSGKTIRVTKDHSLFSLDDYGNVVEAAGGNIKVGDSLIRPKELGCLNNDTIIIGSETIEITNELAEIFGFWIGDGSITSNGNNYRVSCNNKDIEYITSLFEKVGCEYKVYGKESEEHKEVYIDRDVSKKMNDLGFLYTESKDKKIPHFVFGLSRDKICSFIRGYFSADGSIYKNHLELSTCCKSLAKDMSYLCSQVGLNLIYREKNTKNKEINILGKVYKYKNIITYLLQSHNIETLIYFENNINFGQDYKRKLVNEACRISCKFRTGLHRVHSSLFVENLRKNINRKKYSSYKNRNHLIKKRDTYSISSLKEECDKYSVSVCDADILNSNLLVETVFSIKKVSIQDKNVYDLSIEDTQRFMTCSGFFVHNSENKTKDILNLADSIAPCVTGGMKVDLSDGREIPIEEIWNSSDPLTENEIEGVRIRNCPDGIETISMTDSMKKINVKAEKITQKISDDVYEVETQTSKLKITGNHLWPIMSPAGEINWIRTDDLEEGMKCIVPKDLFVKDVYSKSNFDLFFKLGSNVNEKWINEDNYRFNYRLDLVECGYVLKEIKSLCNGDDANKISENIGGNYSEYQNGIRGIPYERLLKIAECYPETLKNEKFKMLVESDFGFININKVRKIDGKFAVYDIVNESIHDISERNLSIEKSMVHNCVVWWDEVENIFTNNGQSNSGTDGGTSSRVLGLISTWMSEHEGLVFNVFTANDISDTPPKLFRKGRLDELFVLDLPVKKEREQILKIHVRKRLVKQDRLDLVDTIDYELLSEYSQNFSGAELEGAINTAVLTCYNENKRPMKTEDILHAIKEIIPMSCTMREQIEHIRNWQEGRAIKASKYDPEKLVEKEEMLRRLKQEESGDETMSNLEL